MIKVLVLYGPPSDPEAFASYYRETHAPLANAIPGMARPVEYGPVTARLDGGESPYFWQATLTFADEASLGAGFGSPEGQAASADVANFATGGATILLAAVE